MAGSREPAGRQLRGLVPAVLALALLVAATGSTFLAPLGPSVRGTGSHAAGLAAVEAPLAPAASVSSNTMFHLAGVSALACLAAGAALSRRSTRGAEVARGAFAYKEMPSPEEWIERVRTVEGNRAVFDVTIPKPLGLVPANFPNRPGVGVAKITPGGNTDSLNRERWPMSLQLSGSGTPGRLERVSTFRFFEERYVIPVLVILVALPSAFVWLLPVLASPKIHFASRCKDYPHCDERLVTVADFLALPQATGGFAAVFFWPTFHMWSLKDMVCELAGRKRGWALVLLFYCCFALTIMVPVADMPAINHLAVGIMLACAVCLFSLLLLHFRHKRRLVLVKLLLGISVLSSAITSLWLAALWLKHCVGNGPSHPPSHPGVWPFAVFSLEATSLTCLSLLPWFWSVGDNLDDSRSLMITDDSTSRDTLVNLHNTGSRLRFPLFFLASAPVAYVWCLPLLASVGFAHRCRGMPRCEESNMGVSVSNFIAKSQATGAMASAFYWPLAHIWSHKGEINGTKNFTLLLIFYIAFGCFLASPVTYYPNVHTAVVAIFCLCGLLYFRGLLSVCRESSLVYCRVLLRISIFAFAGVILVNAVSIAGRVLGHPTLVKDHVPWAFYICEASGLSSMALFPWFWHVRHLGTQPFSFQPH